MKFAHKLIHGGPPLHLCHRRQYSRQEDTWTDRKADKQTSVLPPKGLSVGALKQKKNKQTQ